MEVGVSAPLPLVEKACECALSSYKETGSENLAAQTCYQQAVDGTLPAPERDVSEFYDGDVHPAARDDTNSTKTLGIGTLGLFGFLGSISAVALGIASFVGGLLGWLLVMRKRVLQCDVCGAVVNAS